MCSLFWGGSLVDNIYRGLVFVSIQQSLSFGWGIQSIYVKVIIDKYGPVAIYFIVLDLSLYTLFVFPV